MEKEPPAPPKRPLSMVKDEKVPCYPKQMKESRC